MNVDDIPRIVDGPSCNWLEGGKPKVKTRSDSLEYNAARRRLMEKHDCWNCAQMVNCNPFRPVCEKRRSK